MKRLIVLVLASLSLSASCFAQTWALATSTNPSNGRQIVFRYMNELGPNFQRSSLPTRIILAWKYQSENGMPVLVERQRMDAMEDLLGPLLERDGFAKLAVVSTGENLREWTYYAKSEAEFMVGLNKALDGKPAFPIDVHPAIDPTWSMYEKFRSWVKK